MERQICESHIHDNAPFHTDLIVSEFLAEYSTKVSQAPHSPDQLPWDLVPETQNSIKRNAFGYD